MLIYFYSQLKNEVSRGVLQYLKRANVDVYSNLDAQKSTDISLAEASALVVYDKSLAEESSYFVALALSENKPVLFLTDSKGVKSKSLKNLQDNKNFNNKIQIHACDKKNLNHLLLKFLQQLDQDSGRDIANIKYTLRVSPKMSDYLTWKAEQEAMPKADWLRMLIAQELEHDQAYQQFLQKKYQA